MNMFSIWCVNVVQRKVTVPCAPSQGRGRELAGMQRHYCFLEGWKFTNSGLWLGCSGTGAGTKGDGPVLLSDSILRAPSLPRAPHPPHSSGAGCGQGNRKKQHRTWVTSGEVLQESLNWIVNTKKVNNWQLFFIKYSNIFYNYWVQLYFSSCAWLSG